MRKAFDISPEALAEELLGRPFAELDDDEKRVLCRVASTEIELDPDELEVVNIRLGDRMADRVAAIGGAFLMLLTRCISPEEAYRRVEWKVLILIGSMLSLGAAMEATGTGKFLAEQLISVIGEQSPLLVLMCFFILTVALTQPMSNQAAAIVIVPIAFETAFQLNLNPRSFAMMIAVAASCSYLTPLEPSSLMVFGPGKYRFMDFIKVGFPLTFVIFAIAMVLVPWFWPLR